MTVCDLQDNGGFQHIIELIIKDAKFHIHFFVTIIYRCVGLSSSMLNVIHEDFIQRHG